MEFNKDKILYVPSFSTIDAYIKYTSKPIPVYVDYIDSYDKYWVKRIIPNEETYINGKPYYEVKSITETLTQKEFSHSCHPQYTKERKKFYSDMEYRVEDRDWIYEHLCTNDLVVISYKNVFYVDNKVEKNGTKYICTDYFNSYDGSFWCRSDAKDMQYMPHEVFNTYEECAKYIYAKKVELDCLNSYSDEEVSLQDACRVLKNKGYSAQERHDYLEAMKKCDNVADAELYIRDGKVWISNQNTEDVVVEAPEATEEIKRSKKKWADYVQQCNYITNNVNWYNGKKELKVDE